MAKIILLNAALFLLCGCVSSRLQNSDCSSNQTARIPNSVETFGDPPPPVVKVGGNTFYIDKHNSVVDEELYQQNEEARKPVRDYLDKILEMADQATLGSRAADLALDQWLGAWANGNALTEATEQGKGERKWTLAGLAIVYWRARPHENWHNQKAIETWMTNLTHLVMADYQSYKKTSQRNNHVYWAGLVAITVGTIKSDKELFNWGLEKIRYGLAQIDQEGYLPLELERKTKALQYHRVAIEPLMMSAYFAKQWGIDLVSENNFALVRLAKTTMSGYNDPTVFAAKTGVNQDFKLDGFSTAWLEIYNQLQPEDQTAKRLLKDFKPARNRALGRSRTSFLTVKSIKSCLDVMSN